MGSSPPPVDLVLQSPVKSYSQAATQSTRDLEGKLINVMRFSPVVDIQGGVASVDLPEELLTESKPLWSAFVVGHFMGDAPHIGKVHAIVNRIWSFPDRSAKIDAHFISPRTVLFRIDNQHLKERVLKRTFWHIADIPIVVRGWCPKTASAPPDLTAIPLWADLQGVPDHLFSDTGLTFFGDTIGRTVKLHPNTERCVRLDVARLLVVMNLEEPIPSTINVRGSGETITVSYPWLPPRCLGCQLWGHTDKTCSKNKHIKDKTKGAKEKEKDPVGSDMEAPLTNSAKETEVSKSIDTDKPVQEVENVERTETTIDKEHTEEDGNISVSDKEAGNNGVSENEEPWLMVLQSSPSGSRKLEKPETSKVPEDQSKTSPSRFHLLRKELEEGEIEDEDESESSEGESSVEIRETLEKRKQLEKEKSGNVSVNLLFKSDQCITVWVTSESGEKFLCSCVYASNFAVARQHLWNELAYIKAQYVLPAVSWIVMGDFNETLASSEHSRGYLSNAGLRGMQAFQSAVAHCNLTDLTSIGPTFTWTNKQKENPVAKKLDRVLVNDHWLHQFPQSYGSVEPSGVSDHTRYWVRLTTTAMGKKRPFKFFNFLADHPDFLDTVAASWNSTEQIFHSTSALFRFHKKLKYLKPLLRRLNQNRFGALGTQVLGISRYATVSDAASGGQWNIRRCRGYHLRAMISCINSVPAPAEDADEDRTLWRHGDGEYKEKFSSTKTWEQLRGSYPKLQWCKVVWFRQSIPHFSFITWLAFKDRLATGARTRAWGIVQPCLLCGEPDETRDHLFFACPFSFTVWLDLVGFILGPNANHDWTTTITSITSNRRKETDRCLLKLALQASIHSIWRERNSRRHNNNPTSTGQLVHYIDKTIRNRLSSLRQRNPTFYAETIQRWFERTS
ncbi:hypothetical protein Bca4012_077775 [Brassica carinata]